MNAIHLDNTLPKVFLSKPDLQSDRKLLRLQMGSPCQDVRLQGFYPENPANGLRLDADGRDGRRPVE